jgi:diguanylate cyclase (GGDEF)-like protein
MHSLWRRYWPEKAPDRRVAVASQRALAVFCLLASSSGLAVTLINLKHLDLYGPAIGLGGVIALVCLAAPLWINADENYVRRGQITGAMTMLLLGGLSLMSNHLVSPNNVLLLPCVMTFTLAIGWRSGLMILVSTLGIYVWNYLHTPPEVLAIAAVIDVTTMLIALGMSAVFVFIGATIFRRQIIQVADEITAAHSAAEAAMLHFREQAQTDALTGVANRGAFDDILAVEMQQHANTGRPLTVIVFDLDHFKRVNDTHGHATGDRVLIETARIVKASLRATDTIGRLGGEEFGIILPNVDAREAIAIAEAVRNAISGIRFATLAGHEVEVTASLGIAQRRDTRPAETAGEILERADQRLYEAKRAGRNITVGGKGPVLYDAPEDVRPAKRA